MISSIKTILTIFLILVLLGCVNKNDEPITISLNNWVGYLPIHYIDEKGWMQDEIEFRTVISLMESLKMFQAGLTDGFCGTQYEYERSNIIRQKTVPIILLDRSDGGDAILSNLSLKEIKSSDYKIDVYMEVQSVNSPLFSAFLKEYGLSKNRFSIINTNQHSISQITLDERPKILVTHEPFASFLIHRGYKEVASTKNINLLVVDGLFVKESILHRKADILKRLKDNIIKALDVLKNNPKEFYTTIKPYLEDQSYEEFLKSLDSIEWIVDDRDRELQESLKNHNIPLKWLI